MPRAGTRTGVRLGSVFLDAVEATVQSVASWPAAGTRVDGAEGRSRRSASAGASLPLTWPIWSQATRFTSWL